MRLRCMAQKVEPQSIIPLGVAV
ncbi:Protein of unknown function [Pyronema omphalodes CBS 100304]|uniref:Uncharacterized protein n=1 Tax=Pyronema omphalodes (strain CBS 100304) TaxID=1076935 RepID=U4L750_PYROM|nr:Protein of unknown function [Pyronema omphalodes CBS 100304]